MIKNNIIKNKKELYNNIGKVVVVMKLKSGNKLVKVYNSKNEAKYDITPLAYKSHLFYKFYRKGKIILADKYVNCKDKESKELFPWYYCSSELILKDYLKCNRANRIWSHCGTAKRTVNGLKLVK